MQVPVKAHSQPSVMKSFCLMTGPTGVVPAFYRQENEEKKRFS